ncbi:5'-methylthioadenosine/S-adenosylhomocysteine nucleosidase [Streptomyces lanatus]|uniref:5'-methylthioadenosine/S-adenosylhomocysteine nucleosidase n=1 Tax=Streptomyces lanatus TaxID=66900 RepID=A0ABV1XJB1_9ACTN|nr:5'-methylthioadenosine/S-adenosylhomocysteine nucleosidase [Streptomyces lanatus]GHG91734.1 hypothetical protein GCM10018780_12570 [Streptomyces lanatus]
MGHSPYDIGLIFPLAEEFEYAREAMSFDEPVIEEGRYFHPFDIPGTRLRGVAAVQHDMGLASATLVAADLLNRFKVRMLALIGIAGALDDDLKLGDVVIAQGVEEYLTGVKAEPVPGAADVYEFAHAGTPWNISADMLAYVREFRFRSEGQVLHQSWQREADERRQQAGLPGGLVSDAPRYHVLPIASGDVVVAAEPFARWLKSRNRRLAAVEMEGGGVARTFYNSRGGVELLIIRGISDFADERKRTLDRAAGTRIARGAWRQYATRNAVGLFQALVSTPGLRLPGRGDGGGGATGEGGRASGRRGAGLVPYFAGEKALEFAIDEVTGPDAVPPDWSADRSVADEVDPDGRPGDLDGHPGDVDGGWDDSGYGGEYA